MKVRWTQTAVTHLVAIHEYIARDSPRYAARMVDRITARSQQIGTFPQAGQAVPEYQIDNLREVIEGPYRVIYEVGIDEIRVLAVIHGARLLPPAVSKPDGH
jgi:toxin ParE1/3/4